VAAPHSTPHQKLTRLVGLTCILISAHLSSTPQAATEPSPIRVTLTDWKEQSSDLFCSCNNVEGRVLVFDVSVENPGPSHRTVYLFVWLSNDDVRPHERALWPPEAIPTSLTDQGDLAVSEASAGHRIYLGPGQQEVLIGKAVPQPVGWYDGEPVRYLQLRLLALSPEGEVLAESWEILE